MKKFSELKVGDEFFAESKILLADLEKYLAFSGIKNILYEAKNASDKILAASRLLSNFALQKCADENFPRLLANGIDDFANAYMAKFPK